MDRGRWVAAAGSLPRQAVHGGDCPHRDPGGTVATGGSSGPGIGPTCSVLAGGLRASDICRDPPLDDRLTDDLKNALDAAPRAGDCLSVRKSFFRYGWRPRYPAETTSVPLLF